MVRLITRAWPSSTHSMSAPLVVWQAVDEPLYAHHMKQSPHLQQHRPYINELFKSQSQDGAEVAQKVILGPVDKPVLYIKHMAKHIINLDLSFISKVRRRESRFFLPQ